MANTSKVFLDVPGIVEKVKEQQIEDEKEQKRAVEDQKNWATMRELVAKLAQEFAKLRPGAGKGAYKYYLFNTVKW